MPNSVNTQNLLSEISGLDPYKGSIFIIFANFSF